MLVVVFMDKQLCTCILCLPVCAPIFYRCKRWYPLPCFFVVFLKILARVEGVLLHRGNVSKAHSECAKLNGDSKVSIGVPFSLLFSSPPWKVSLVFSMYFSSLREHFSVLYSKNIFRSIVENKSV